jgi:uncharacterized damage-inducible protein DinB
MNNSVKPLAAIFKVNSTLLINTFNDVTEEFSLRRPNKKTNSMMFVLLHTMDARYFLLRNIGVEIKNPFGKYVDWANTIDDIKKYPKLKSVLAEWKKLDKILDEKLNRISSKKLDAKLDMDFAGGKKVLNMIAFLAEHEAYHVGQLAFIRKFLGMKAVMF